MPSFSFLYLAVFDPIMLSPAFPEWRSVIRQNRPSLISSEKDYGKRFMQEVRANAFAGCTENPGSRQTA